MKIAALILVHKDLEQVKRLIDALQHPDIDIYIHIDKKCPLTPSDFDNPNLRFTQKRFDITLFDFSMVDAEMELLRTAKQTGDYGYYALLSGQCYPLRHVDDIYDYLLQTYPKPYLEVASPEIVTKFARHFKYPHTLKKFRVGSFAFIEKYFPTKSIYPYKYVPELIVYIATAIIGLFVKSPEKRLAAMGMKPYRGGQWWILPDKAVQHILPLYENEEFCKSMRDSFSSDESFFQTAIMAYAEQFDITLDDKGYYRNKKWFTIFSHGHPITLTHEHFDKMFSSDMLFARKFDMSKTPDIFDKIDEHNLALKNQKIAD